MDNRLHALGYDSLWQWLAAHPSLDWVEVGQELGFVPVAVMSKSAREAPSLAAAVRQSLLRNLRRYFRDGWDPTATFPRAQLAGKLYSEFRDTPIEAHDELLARLDRMPTGWKPMGPDDPALVAVIDSLFER